MLNGLLKEMEDDDQLIQVLDYQDDSVLGYCVVKKGITLPEYNSNIFNRKTNTLIFSDINAYDACGDLENFNVGDLLENGLIFGGVINAGVNEWFNTLKEVGIIKEYATDLGFKTIYR